MLGRLGSRGVHRETAGGNEAMQMRTWPEAAKAFSSAKPSGGSEALKCSGEQ
jgi:hypothetical protein